MPLILHYHPLSSHCWKLLIALAENGTPFEPRIVNLGDPTDRAAFAALWPTAKIPLLVDGDQVVPETSIQMEYLDHHHPGATRLLPVGAIDRRGRLIGGGDARLHEIGIAVPGAALVGAALEGSNSVRRGANYAAALIAGVAGLLLGAQSQHGQTPDPGAAGEAILNSATPRMADRAQECQRAWIGRANIEAAASRLTGVLQDTAAASPFGRWHRAQTISRQSDHAAFRPRA